MSVLLLRHCFYRMPIRALVAFKTQSFACRFGSQEDCLRSPKEISAHVGSESMQESQTVVMLATVSPVIKMGQPFAPSMMCERGLSKRSGSNVVFVFSVCLFVASHFACWRTSEEQ